MIQIDEYDKFLYSSHSLEIENLHLTVTLDNAMHEKKVQLAPLHSHPVFELQAVLSGALSLRFSNAESVELDEHEICLIPPDLYHSVMPKTETKRLTLRFSCTRIGESQSEDFYNRFASLDRATHLTDTAPIISLLFRIRDEVLSPMAASVPLCHAYLSELFILLYRCLGEAENAKERLRLSQSDDENARYNKIELMMQRHMAEFFREEDLAKALGLSVRQTSRVMQRIFGMSFRKKLLELRLHHAKGLLITTQEPMEQIATTVGYTSPSGFHIAFKKAFGVTPGEYREQNLL